VTREEVTTLLANAAAAGQLGLFVGSGFSIALTSGQQDCAPTWRTLLEMAAKDLQISMPEPNEIYGRSFPQIASHLVDLMVESQSASKRDGTPLMQSTIENRRALWQLKTTIAKLTHLQVDHERRKHWMATLEAVAPAWIVTTNYDLLLEDLIPNS
jgi:hypothetical protein